MRGEVLVAGEGQGPLLKLQAPISFWGGVDPATGTIVDVRHPDHGKSVAGTVLALPGTIGSSSSSSVLLELVRTGNAPAALLLAEVDAILLLGLIVAREMGWRPCPALRIEAADMPALAPGDYRVETDGRVRRR